MLSGVEAFWVKKIYRFAPTRSSVVKWQLVPRCHAEPVEALLLKKSLRLRSDGQLI